MMKQKYTEEQAKELLLQSEKYGKSYIQLSKKSGWSYEELKKLYNEIHGDFSEPGGLTGNGAVILGSKIVEQAVDDYKKAYKDLKKNPNCKSAQKTIRELNRFFDSDHFRDLMLLDCYTPFDSKMITDKIEQAVDTELRQKEWLKDLDKLTALQLEFFLKELEEECKNIASKNPGRRYFTEINKRISRVKKVLNKKEVKV